MKETCSKFVQHIVHSSISGEVWAEAVQSNIVGLVDFSLLQVRWVTP